MVETRDMSQEKVKLAVRPRGKPLKNLPDEITVAATDPTKEIYAQVAIHAKTPVHQLRITKGSDGSFIQSSKDLLVDTTGLRQQSMIYVKDMGAQVAWRTVFVVEYLGPLIIHPVFYLTLPRPGPSALQTLTFALTMIHFGKRELETLFVHRFSSATMPFANVIRNSAYYWALSGVNMAYWVYLPSSSSSAAGESNPYITSLGLVLFVIGEVCNYRTHIILRDLRSAGGAERGIPQGLGFSLVTCPNYMFEFLAWIGVILVSWSLSTILFVGVASSVMAVWAKKKESKYRREFGSKYRRKRYVFLPGIW